MFLSILFAISQITLGLMIVKFFDKENRFYFFEKILCAIILGGVLSGFFVLGLAILFKSLFIAILVFIFIAMATFFWFGKSWWHQPKISFSFANIFSLKNAWLIPLLLILIIYWILIYSVLFQTNNGTLRGALVGWGDIALHLSMIQRMATSQPFIIDNPIMAGAHLTYPFLINFLSAIFLKLDSNIIFAFRFPLLVYGTTALLCLFAIAFRVLKSKPFAVLALVLIIYGSGLGFLVFSKDLKIEYQNNGLSNIVEFFKNTPHEYTHLDNRTGGKLQEKNTNDNIVWMAPKISFLSHQRSFSLGLAIFSFVLLSIIVYGKNPTFWRFGIIAGLLPFAHIHSFLALFFLMSVLFWFNFKYFKSWLRFGFITAVIALPQILYFKSANKILSLNFIKPWFGWMTCEHSLSWLECDPLIGTDSNAFIFWLKNFGIVFLIWLFIIIVAGTFILIKKSPFYRGSTILPEQRLKPELKLEIPFIVASLVLFILPNLFLFQPWPFDNNKIIFYWWIMAILFCVSPFLVFLWHKKLVGKILVVALLFFAILAGSIDVISRIISPRELYFYGYSDLDNDKVKTSQWIKDNTPANALFLTSPSVDSPPLFLAGRPIYLGFEGWLWSEGLDYSKNQKIAKQILEGDLNLACQEKIDYILLDNDLRRNFFTMEENQVLSQGKIVFSQQKSLDQNYIIKTPCQNSPD